MSELSPKTRLVLLVVLLAGVVLAFWAGLQRLHIQTDITAALPQSDPVVKAAQDIMRRNGVLGSVIIDLSLDGPQSDRDRLVEAANLVERELMASGLIRSMDARGAMEALPGFLAQMASKLPVLFNQDDLSNKAASLLQPKRIRAALKQAQKRLLGLGGIGQARIIAQDPLGMSNLMLGALGRAAPVIGSSIYDGRLFSLDNRHLLMAAKPAAGAGDTAFARRLRSLLEGIKGRLENNAERGARLNMVYVGAFRAALDNENIIKQDTTRALVLVSLGLALLIFFCFRRPWIGLLALIPAVAGAMLATFFYSLMHPTIFALSLGFGGALIAIAVDHGLAYVLLLDRPFEVRGANVSRELWQVARFPVLTTVAALLALTLSGIPLFEEVGLFAALGVGLSALFVHLFFPLAFVRLKGTERNTRAPVERLVGKLSSGADWKVAAGVLIFALVMFFCIRLDFTTDIQSMNTVSPSTAQAEKAVEKTWGTIFQCVYIMARAPNLAKLWEQANRMGAFLERQSSRERLSGDPPMLCLLPGPARQARNLKAWRRFWTPVRRRALKTAMAEAGEDMGFSSQAFAPFLKMVSHPPDEYLDIPTGLLRALGVNQGRQGAGWALVGRVTPGPSYKPEAFFKEAAAAGFSVFDAQFFSLHLAQRLASSFGWMLVLIASCAAALLGFLFVDWQLILTALAPLAFALAATLGTMGLLGIPLSMPSLMLAPVILGMGLDYGLYLVRARQRYGRSSHPNMAPFRLTVLLGGLSTLVGMGSLALSEHAVLREAGITTFLGIFYSMAGAFAFTPPLLGLLYSSPPATAVTVSPDSRMHRKLVMNRFRHLEPHPRLFAYFKMLCDPMFHRLAFLLGGADKVLDVGCGYGVPAAWLLVLRPNMEFHCLEPDRRRARIAARVLKGRGHVHQGAAPDLTPLPTGADAALLLDMAHYLDDDEMRALLKGLRNRLAPGGRLVMRATEPKPGKFAWLRWVEAIRMALAGKRPHFRSSSEMAFLLKLSGFQVKLVEPAARGREETWFTAIADGNTAG